jgi:hypothetical protein
LAGAASLAVTLAAPARWVEEISGGAAEHAQ